MRDARTETMRSRDNRCNNNANSIAIDAWRRVATRNPKKPIESRRKAMLRELSSEPVTDVGSRVSPRWPLCIPRQVVRVRPSLAIPSPLASPPPRQASASHCPPCFSPLPCICPLFVLSPSLHRALLGGNHDTDPILPHIHVFFPAWPGKIREWREGREESCGREGELRRGGESRH